MNIVKQIFDLLVPAERKRAFWLLTLILAMAMFDTLGVASILPFIAVLGNPEIISNSSLLNYIFELSQYFGIENVDQFLFFLGAIVFFLFITSLAVKSCTMYLQIRFVLLREYSIGTRLVDHYLHKPYSWFLSNNSASIEKTILSEVSNVINNGMLPLMLIIANGTVALAILVLLFVIDPILATSVSLVLILCYLAIFSLTKSLVNRLGQTRIQVNEDRFSVVDEAFASIKTIKVGGHEAEYIERFARPAKIFATGQATANIIGQMPRYMLEAVAFGGMLMLVLILMALNDDFEQVVPVVALYAFAGYRLMPALQQIYAASIQLRYVAPAVEALHHEVQNLGREARKSQKIDDLRFQKQIRLESVSYSYPDSQKQVIRNINVCIPFGHTVGLVGKTGSGKSTIIDVIMGLLVPDHGCLTVDDIPLQYDYFRQWQRMIGYVPQDIFLADTSIAANIAYGIKPEKIDNFAVERAAKIANLHDFIINELPKGYGTIVGERGVRLSGGQRQRIGIARALYNSPRVLVMDEATSALDNSTESAVMDAINNIGGDITIILVAHRLSTVRDCDTIYYLKNGEVSASGSYVELMENSTDFISLASGN